MHESTKPNVQTALVPAEVGHRALLRAREEVHPGCHLLMTSDTGMVALVLPDRLRDSPETPELQLRLAAIAHRLNLHGQATKAGEMLATSARRSLGGSLAARTARRVEPAASSRPRRERIANVASLRPVLR
ncbi:MAG: hypothetical protein OXP69_22010 [Spirochaetaceae bacterium]|nr:hypothetical protein [Spirochaetaceae bacterium]MDE0230080.1 hypothetical protein [Spirochaetaceae bacterium]